MGFKGQKMDRNKSKMCEKLKKVSMVYKNRPKKLKCKEVTNRVHSSK